MASEKYFEKLMECWPLLTEEQKDDLLELARALHQENLEHAESLEIEEGAANG